MNKLEESLIALGLAISVVVVALVYATGVVVGLVGWAISAVRRRL